MEQRHRRVARRAGALPVPSRLRPPSGARCWLVGLVVGAGFIAAAAFLLDVARGDALPGIVEDFPDQADLIQDVALVLAAIVIVPLVWMAWLVIAGSFDLFSTVERQGVVVRARRPQRVVPFPRLLRPLARRDRFALFIAVDDGRSDRVSAWLSNERTAVPQGARARVRRRRCSATSARPSRSARTHATAGRPAMPSGCPGCC